MDEQEWNDLTKDQQGDWIEYLVKWFSYIMITLIVIMFMNNWFDDGTGSMFMPDEIYEDQYDPQGLNKKKGI